MVKDKLKFDFTSFYVKAEKIKKKIGLTGVTINLPFISFDFSSTDKEKKIAREIIIRIRDKRVLNSKECCNNCIENALTSLQDIRQLLVDKQVEIEDIESPLFLLADFSIYGIRRFLTFIEFYKPEHNQQEYFEALEIIRGHLLRTFDAINQIAELPEGFGYRYEHTPVWDKTTYFLDTKQ